MAKRRKAKSFVSNDIESYLHETDKRKNTLPENPKEWRRKAGWEFGMVSLLLKTGFLQRDYAQDVVP